MSGISTVSPYAENPSSAGGKVKRSPVGLPCWAQAQTDWSPRLWLSGAPTGSAACTLPAPWELKEPEKLINGMRTSQSCYKPVYFLFKRLVNIMQEPNFFLPVCVGRGWLFLNQ